LRNRIYKFAFATETGIGLFPGPRPIFVTHGYGLKVELNQLKYTCRKLYDETAGLEVKLNRVQIVGQDSDLGPAKLFLDYIANCAPQKAGGFRNVTLLLQNNQNDDWDYDLDIMLEQKQIIASLGKFYREDPLVHVCYVPACFSFQSSSGALFMDMGLWPHYVVRGKDLNLVATGDDYEESCDVGAVEWHIDIDIADVPNLRFRPPEKRLAYDVSMEELQEYIPRDFKLQACVDLLAVVT
jgi:hypothetical protein